MKPLFASLLALALCACAQDPHELQLADLDLLDMSVAQDVRQRLVAADRPIFATYIAKHLPGSAGFCGEVLVNGQGREPLTVGEAIALTMVREKAAEEARLARLRPPTPEELRERQAVSLNTRREALIARMSMLEAEHGPAAWQQPGWREIEEQMADLDRQSAALMQPGGV